MQHARHDIVLTRDVDDLLLDVRGLALVRELLAERGATRAELTPTPTSSTPPSAAGSDDQGHVPVSDPDDGGLGAAA